MNHGLVLDTNVLVSAAIHLDGPPGFLVQAILRRELACFTCPGVVEEYWDVLTRPKFARLGFPPPWFEPLLDEAHHLDADPLVWPLEGPDPDDLVFLALAHHTGAVLVTGNLADYPEAIQQGVQVMSPRAYLEELG
ncbi:MAG: PIN domain-containing protein [Geothrix sp.]|nr:PIN domain-containing protein [Geothrix sp.]